MTRMNCSNRLVAGPSTLFVAPGGCPERISPIRFNPPAPQEGTKPSISHALSDGRGQTKSGLRLRNKSGVRFGGTSAQTWPNVVEVVGGHDFRCFDREDHS